MTTLERLAELEAAATPGLWHADDLPDTWEDVEFIAELRNAAPALLAVAEAARASLASGVPPAGWSERRRADDALRAALEALDD